MPEGAEKRRADEAELLKLLEDYRKETWEGLSKMFDGVKKEVQ